MKKSKNILLALFAVAMLSACTVVKEYEKVMLNDPDMVLSPNKIDKGETAAQAYREGSSGANGGKGSGGCGCN